ncbi:unnamed protein product [Linum trigynum]|uniref:Uncharacterized protein n=1 Tax=Linum trigynum TaxID=586398 RepID=A0AAV2FKN9_9ROSI
MRLALYRAHRRPFINPSLLQFLSPLSSFSSSLSSTTLLDDGGPFSEFQPPPETNPLSTSFLREGMWRSQNPTQVRSNSPPSRNSAADPSLNIGKRLLDKPSPRRVDFSNEIKALILKKDRDNKPKKRAGLGLKPAISASENLYEIDKFLLPRLEALKKKMQTSSATASTVGTSRKNEKVVIDELNAELEAQKMQTSSATASTAGTSELKKLRRKQKQGRSLIEVLWQGEEVNWLPKLEAQKMQTSSDTASTAGTSELKKLRPEQKQGQEGWSPFEELTRQGEEVNWLPRKEEAVVAELNAELEAQEMQPSSATASTAGTSGKKKRKSAQAVDDRIDLVVGEMSEFRTVIKHSVETIARALGESDDLIQKRANLLKTLEELEGFSRAEIITALRKLSNNDRDLMIFYGLEEKADKVIFVTGLLR